MTGTLRNLRENLPVTIRKLEDVPVEIDEGIHCLVLGRGGHMEVNGKMIEERFGLFLAVSQIYAAAHLMKERIALHPHTIALLGAYRIVPTPHRPPDFIHEHTRHGAIQPCRNPPDHRRIIEYC